LLNTNKCDIISQIWPIELFSICYFALRGSLLNKAVFCAMDSLLKFIEEKRNILLYGVIGISAVVVDMLFFALFYNLMSVPPVTSTIFSVSLATVYSFLLNHFYNFKSKDLIKQRFFFFILVSLGGMILSAITIEILYSIGIDANLAKAISLPPIVILQYLFNKKLTFKETVVMENNNNSSMEVSKIVKKNIAIVGGGFTGLTAAYTASRFMKLRRLLEDWLVDLKWTDCLLRRLTTFYTRLTSIL
jgi:putative flippase GtrA